MDRVSVIFQRTLRDYRRSIFWWSFGMAFLAFYVTIIYPMISEFEQFNTLLESPLFQSLIPGLSEFDYTSIEGFLGIEFFTWMPLVLAVFAVLFGANIVGGEEDKGTIDILLSTPTPRWQIIVAKTGTFVLALVVIAAVSAVAMVFAVKITPDMEISMSNVALAMLNAIPGILFMMTLTLLLSTLMRSKGRASGIAAAVIVGSYFTSSFAQMADSAILSFIENFSFYKYYNAISVLKNGIIWGDFLLLTAVSAVLFGLSIHFFNRRDIYV